MVKTNCSNAFFNSNSLGLFILIPHLPALLHCLVYGYGKVLTVLWSLVVHTRIVYSRNLFKYVAFNIVVYFVKVWHMSNNALAHCPDFKYASNHNRENSCHTQLLYAQFESISDFQHNGNGGPILNPINATCWRFKIVQPISYFKLSIR